MKVSKVAGLSLVLFALSSLARAQATTATLLDLTSNTQISNFTVGSGPTAVVWSGNSLAYIVNDEDNTLVRLDMTTSPPTITSTFTFADPGFGPHGLAINPAGTRALVSGDTTSVLLLNLTTTPFTVADTINVTLDANGVAFYAAGARAIVVNEGNLRFLDLSTVPAGVTTVPLAAGKNGLAVAVNALGTRAAVTIDDGGLQIVDLTTTPPSLVGSAVGPIGPNSDPLGVAISPDGTRAIYVDEENPSEANVINIVGPPILVNSVPIALLSPSAVAFNPVSSAVLIAADNGVVILNPPYTAVTTTIIHPLRRGATTYSIAVNPAGTRALVLHEDILFCPYPIDFGNVVVGTTSPTFTEVCTNVGVGSLTVNAVSASGTGFALTGVPALPVTVPAGGTFSFGVTFTPPIVGPQTGSFNGDFVVLSNGFTGTFSSSLLGNGVAAPANFFTLTPCRVADTRNPVGPYGGPALAANADRSFVIANQCGIPTTATAVSFNVTITQPTALGDLRLFPGGASLPLVSTLNWKAGQTRANNAIVSLGASGDIGVHVDQASGTVHFIIDVNGYFQ